MQRPRHAGDGLKKGLTVAAVGIGAGVASIFALPALGARENGVWGFATGVGKGLLAGTVLIGGGVIGGVAQIGRGECTFRVTTFRLNHG